MNIPKKSSEANPTYQNYQTLLHMVALALKLMVDTETKEERKRIQQTTIEYGNRLMESWSK